MENYLFAVLHATVVVSLLVQLLHNLPTAESPGPGVEVRLDAGGNRGKGLFTTKSFNKGDLIFAERPLVGSTAVGERGPRELAAMLVVADSRGLNSMLPAVLQVGIQELDSKIDTATCAKCFTAVGEHCPSCEGREEWCSTWHAVGVFSHQQKKLILPL